MSSRGGNRSAAAPAAHNPALSMIKEHAFLQAVMQRGYMSESEAKRIYKMVYSKEFVGADAAVISKCSSSAPPPRLIQR